MARTDNKWRAGITAGMLAGAAGATAMNAVSYLDQSTRGGAATTSPAGPTPADTAQKLTGVSDPARNAALGPLGGLGIGVGVGAVAGVLRSATATPPRALAAVLTGLAAFGVGEGVALATGTTRPDGLQPATLVRDLASHLAYGAVTGLALHRMLDPNTRAVRR